VSKFYVGVRDVLPHGDVYVSPLKK